ncbi:kinase domain protein [Tetrahymena thermophila SB210]|uniref:Kinase domain protein n=1 Tax=Tetrahymena thermophila (strain SB210) TaxID=312017 RepID=A0A1B9C251_TETTS|nr:kinase domain protein [Tetrahymena thermophila SB210]
MRDSQCRMSFISQSTQDSGSKSSNTPVQYDKYSIEKLFDPVQVSYIKSYKESAVGKYFYWDLLAEKYFNIIYQELKQVIWMEEDVIELYFDHKFTQNDSYIIKKKVWKLRNKSQEIEVTKNISNKIIWKYKSCSCK